MRPDNPPLTKTRYNYFDAIRGFSMILIVFWHVMLCSIDSTDGINIFFCTFLLALFFFISGFFAYKPFDLWNNSRIKDTLISRFKVLFLGTCTFIIIHSIFFSNSLPDITKFNFAVDGYWFTLLLLNFYIVYISVMIICRNTINRDKIFWGIMAFISIICICIHHNFMNIGGQVYSHFPVAIIHIISPRFFYFFPYFVLGLLARTFLPQFIKILSDHIARLIVLVLIVSLWSISFLSGSPFLKPANLNGDTLMAYPLGIPAVILVIQFFYGIRYKFDQNTRFSNGIKFIGRRTLDIYFIHYFFLPDLHFIKPYLASGNPVTLQLIIGLTVSMIIVGLTLLTGQVIRMSPVLAEWLLGARKNESNIKA